MKICLDAGHYSKYNQSPVFKSYYESEMTWRLHRMLQAELELRGHEVIVTREKQQIGLAVNDRGLLAKNCDLMISIHSNASDNSSKNAVHVYRSVSADEEAITLAEEFGKSISRVMDTTYAVRTRESETSPGWDYYGIMKGARQAGCKFFYIIEHGYHTNEAQAKWLYEGENLSQLAVAEADVIDRWAKGEFKKEESSAVMSNYISEFQTASNSDGWMPALKVDGKFGPKTQESMEDTLRLKRRGHRVVLAQKLLGISNGDGIYDEGLEKVVKEYQQSKKLTADGLLGLSTWKSLMNL